MLSAPQRSDEKQGARAGNVLPSLICQPILQRLTASIRKDSSRRIESETDSCGGHTDGVGI